MDTRMKIYEAKSKYKKIKRNQDHESWTPLIMRNTQLGTNFWSTGVISHSSVCFCTGTETFFDLFEN